MEVGEHVLFKAEVENRNILKCRYGLLKEELQ